MHAQVLRRSCTIRTCFFHLQLYLATGDVVKNLYCMDKHSSNIHAHTLLAIQYAYNRQFGYLGDLAIANSHCAVTSGNLATVWVTTAGMIALFDAGVPKAVILKRARHKSICALCQNEHVTSQNELVAELLLTIYKYMYEPTRAL